MPHQPFWPSLIPEPRSLADQRHPLLLSTRISPERSREVLVTKAIGSIVRRFFRSMHIYGILMTRLPRTACDTSVEISMKFGDGPLWPINPADFELARIGQGVCIGALFELDLAGSASPDWIIGDTFLVRISCPRVGAND